jgi:hypothetical protein
MDYTRSVNDFFKSPKWGMNMLLGAVAVLIPVVGQLVLAGWHVTIFWARGDDEDPAKFPAFDFQNFGKYLERGLWPFLVNLAASLLLVPLMMLLVAPLFFLTILADSKNNSGAAVGLVIAAVFILQIALMMIYHFVVTPLMLRAAVTQDFRASFDIAFVRDFLARMWREMIVCMCFMFGLGLCMVLVTVITCYIGMFFAAPVVMFSWHHLQKQIYQLYLARGGRVVPLSPKLHDLPPALDSRMSGG